MGDAVKKVPVNEIEIKEHLELLHTYKNTDGWVSLATIKEKFNQKHYKNTTLLNAILNLEELINVYISQNSFYKPQRRIENIRQLRALFIDIDCYDEQMKMSKEGVIYFLEKDYYGTTIPTPSLTIDSGRGLYLLWLIEPVSSQALPLWNAIQKHFYHALKEFGADACALDCTRVLRLPNSINSKSNTLVKVIDTYDYRYTLREIQQNYLPELKPKKTQVKQKGRPKKIVNLYNTYSLHHARLLDLIKLCELRNWDMEGYREVTLFLYRYWTLCFTEDYEKALDDALEINQQFKKPLDKKKVVKVTKSAEQGFEKWASDNKLSEKEKKKLQARQGYNYTNERLIEMLRITEEEQKKLKTIISIKEKYERNNKRRTPRNKEGLTKREQQKKEKVEEVKDLHKRGLKQIEISEKLKISTRYVKKILANN